MDSKNDQVIVIRQRGTFREIFGCTMAFIAFTFVFLLMLSMSLSDFEPSDDFRPGIFLLIFGAGMVFTLGAVIRYGSGTKVIFDTNARKTVFKTPFSRAVTIDFGDIARIAPVTCRTVFSQKQGFCLVPRGDWIFEARRFSPLFRKGSAKLIRFESETLPGIERAIGLSEDVPPSESKSAVRPEDAGYARQSGRYIKSNYRRLASGAVACIVLLLAGIKLLGFGGEDPVVLGLLIAIASFVGLIYIAFQSVRAIEVDANRNTLEIAHGLLFGRRKSYPFTQVASFEITNFYGNWFMRKQRSLSLRVAGLKKPIQLSRASNGTQKAEKLRSELALLAELMQKDPLRDVNYVETRVG